MIGLKIEVETPIEMVGNGIMRLFVLCSLAVMLASTQGLASAFGFKAGMTKDQIVAIVGTKALTEVKGDMYTFSTAPTPHPEFEEYLCIISPKEGLMKVVAISKDIETNRFGDAVKERFAQIQAGVSKTYGKGDSYDLLQDGSMWNDPQDWMMGLLKKDRELVTYWKLSTPQDHITIVALEAKALSMEKGYLKLVYEFEGWEQYVDKKKERQDTVF